MPYKVSTDYKRMVELLEAGETLVYKHYRTTRYWSQISAHRVGNRLLIYGCYTPQKWIEVCAKNGTVFIDPADYGGAR